MPAKILTREGSIITFGGAGGATNQVAMTLAGLVNGAGRISAQFDLRTLYAGARPQWWRWSARVKYTAAATIGYATEIYLATSDGTLQDGSLGTADAALSNSECRRNLQRVGVIDNDVSSGTPYMQASGIVQIVNPLISLVVWDNSGQTFTATAADHVIMLTALIDEVQNWA